MHLTPRTPWMHGKEIDSQDARCHDALDALMEALDATKVSWYRMMQE